MVIRAPLVYASVCTGCQRCQLIHYNIYRKRIKTVPLVPLFDLIICLTNSWQGHSRPKTVPLPCPWGAPVVPQENSIKILVQTFCAYAHGRLRLRKKSFAPTQTVVKRLFSPSTALSFSLHRAVTLPPSRCHSPSTEPTFISGAG